MDWGGGGVEVANSGLFEKKLEFSSWIKLYSEGRERERKRVRERDRARERE